MSNIIKDSYTELKRVKFLTLVCLILGVGITVSVLAFLYAFYTTMTESKKLEMELSIISEREYIDITDYINYNITGISNNLDTIKGHDIDKLINVIVDNNTPMYVAVGSVSGSGSLDVRGYIPTSVSELNKSKEDYLIKYADEFTNSDGNMRINIDPIEHLEEDVKYNVTCIYKDDGEMIGIILKP